MASTAVNHPHAGQAGANGGKNEFIQSESRFLLIHPMQVQPRLNGKTSGSQIVQVEPPPGLHGPFDVLGGLLDFNVAVSEKMLQRAQGVGFIILWLDFAWGTMVEGNGAPAQRFHILHRMTEQIVIVQAHRQARYVEVPLLPINRAIQKSNPALAYEFFQNCEWFVHTAPEQFTQISCTRRCTRGIPAQRKRFVIGIRRSRPKARGVIFTPGAAWRRLYSLASTRR